MCVCIYLAWMKSWKQLNHLRFQEKIDTVKEVIKNPCADFLSVELKYKMLKKDIQKAKKAREQQQEKEKADTEDVDQDTDQPEETERKPKRRRTKSSSEPLPKAKAKAAASTVTKAASKKRKRTWCGQSWGEPRLKTCSVYVYVCACISIYIYIGVMFHIWDFLSGSFYNNIYIYIWSSMVPWVFWLELAPVRTWG